MAFRLLNSVDICAVCFLNYYSVCFEQYGVRLCTEDTLAFFTQRAHNLRQLVVGGSPFLDGTALRKVCRSGQQPWERLHVAECPLTDDDANYLSLLTGDTVSSFFASTGVAA